MARRRQQSPVSTKGSVRCRRPDPVQCLFHTAVSRYKYKHKSSRCWFTPSCLQSLVGSSTPNELQVKKLTTGAMRLRSGRRLFSPVAAPRGVRPRRRTPDGGGDGVGENDRLSSLPLDLQLEVLARLHTSVLSRQWRGLWTQLQELSFDQTVGPDSLAGALSRLGELAQVRPKLRRLCIHLPGNVKLGDARISSLLLAADKLAPLELVVTHVEDSAADATAPEEAGPQRSQRPGKPNPKYFSDEWVQV